MLRSMHELKGYTIGATDGEIGNVSDFFFDDRAWFIRYLVVETGSWLLSRKVLMSPSAITEADWMHKRLPVRITREQVKHSPDIDTERPVSRQHEMQYADYYGYPYYWGGDGLWGDGAYLPVLTQPKGRDPLGDQHLRSCKAVIGYDMHALDGEIGYVQGMLVDEAVWAIRYLVVETSGWWEQHQVLISPDWFTAISWEHSTVSVNLTRKAIQDSPRFDSTAALNRQHEIDLHQHYARPNYWEQDNESELATTQY